MRWLGVTRRSRQRNGFGIGSRIKGSTMGKDKKLYQGIALGYGLAFIVNMCLGYMVTKKGAKKI